MKFNYYDTLVNLVLGYLLLFLVIAVEGIEYIENFSMAYIAAGFVLGYFINALSSIVEPIYFWTFGGKPSVKIFRVNKNCEYSGIKAVPFYETQKAINYLKEGEDKDNENKWFEIATRTIGNNKDSRVSTFNEHYAFSRVMLTFVIISIAILIPRYYDCWQFYVISIPMLTIAWYRCKMRGYYYVREVLKEYINIKENK